MALRDHIAGVIDDYCSPRDLVGLSKRLADLVMEIERPDVDEKPRGLHIVEDGPFDDPVDADCRNHVEQQAGRAALHPRSVARAAAPARSFVCDSSLSSEPWRCSIRARSTVRSRTAKEAERRRSSSSSAIGDDNAQALSGRRPGLDGRDSRRYGGSAGIHIPERQPEPGPRARLVVTGGRLAPETSTGHPVDLRLPQPSGAKAPAPLVKVQDHGTPRRSHRKSKSLQSDTTESMPCPQFTSSSWRSLLPAKSLPGPA